jgi:hypothetical protein
MIIIKHEAKINTDTDTTVLIFNSDKELNDFISLLATTQVKTSGVRVLTLIPKGKQLSPIQDALINLIDSIDGIGGKENDAICDNAIDGIDSILRKYS